MDALFTLPRIPTERELERAKFVFAVGMGAAIGAMVPVSGYGAIWRTAAGTAGAGVSGAVGGAVLGGLAGSFLDGVRRFV